MLRKLWFVTAFLGLAGVLSVAVRAEQSGSNGLTDNTRDVQIKRYYNQDAVSHTTGTVMLFVTPTVATYPGLSISTGVIPYAAQFAGIVYGKTLPANDWGYVQTRGFNPGVNIASATAFGDLIWPSATAGSASAHSGVFVASESCNSFGVALGVQVSSAQVPALIK